MPSNSNGLRKGSTQSRPGAQERGEGVRPVTRRPRDPVAFPLHIHPQDGVTHQASAPACDSSVLLERPPPQI